MYLNDLSRTLVAERDYMHTPFSERTPDSNKERFKSSLSLEETEAFRLFNGIYESRRDSLVSLTSFFWGIFSYSEVFRFVEYFLRIGNPLSNDGRLILTMHKDDQEQEHYDLLVLSRELKTPRPFVVRLADILAAYPGADLNEHLRITVYGLLRDTLGIQPDYIADTLYELATAVDFNVIFAPMPEMQLTTSSYSNCISNPSCGISLTTGIGPTSTAGVLTTDKSGRIGFTATLHGVLGIDDPKQLVELYNQKGAACVLGRQVYINGVPGTVCNADLMTDSCFVEIPPDCAIDLAVCNGPLKNRPPYRGEKVSFDGITSHNVTTNVTEVDVLVPNVNRFRQAMVYTKPVTNRGDSGAALLNSEGQVLGFNHARTGFNAPVEMAEWIWADSVYNALNL